MTNIREEDKHIGGRIRQRRVALGLTQQDVAAGLGLSFQQLQKYETGYNRVSGSKMCDIARILNVAPSYFFEGINGVTPIREIKSSEEASLLIFFRKSSAAAQQSLLDVAEATAAVTNPTTAQIGA